MNPDSFAINYKYLRMKYILIILLFAISVEWNNKWFTMEISRDWNKLDRDIGKDPVISSLFKNAHLYKDVRTTSKQAMCPGFLEVHTYTKKDGGKLDYQHFLKKLSFNRNIYVCNNLTKVRSDSIFQIWFEGKLVPHYSSRWCIKGQNRIYVIEFSSYDKCVYDKYLGTAVESVKTFKERE